MTRRHLLSLALAALAAAGCGSSGGDPDADPAALVPARAPIYLEADLKLEGDEQDAVNALGQKLAGTDRPGADLKRLIERELREDDRDFSFAKDIDPWLGDRIAVFVSRIAVSGTSPKAQAAVVAPAEDTGKARTALEAALRERDAGEPAPRVVERTYRDVDLKVETTRDTAVAIVDDYAVVGDEGAVKAAIDAREGEALAGADAYRQARAEVAEDGLGIAYVGTSQLISALGPRAAAVRPLLGRAGRSLAVALDADPDALRIESAAVGVTGPAPRGDAARVVGDLPGAAWLAAGTPDVGTQLEESLRQAGQLGAFGGIDLEQILGQVERQTGIDVRKDLVSWMGDAGLFVQGDTLGDLSGALVMRSKDPGASRGLVPKIARTVRRFAPGVTVRPLPASLADTDAGISLRFAGLPLPVHLAAKADRFVVAVTDAGLETALKPSRPLRASPAFQAAAGELGDGVRPSFFLDLAPVRELIDATGAAEGRDARRARRGLEALSSVVGGGAREGDVQRGRVVVGVR